MNRDSRRNGPAQQVLSEAVDSLLRELLTELVSAFYSHREVPLRLWERAVMGRAMVRPITDDKAVCMIFNDEAFVMLGRVCETVGRPKALQKVKHRKTIMRTITVETVVQAPLKKVWECWTKPEHITGWAFASDDWEAPAAENDLRVGGKVKIAMAAKDKSSGFDFTGTYTAVKEHELIEYDVDDGRHVKVELEETPNGMRVRETFEPEHENSEEMQRFGWQAILDNFKKHVEGCR